MVAEYEGNGNFTDSSSAEGDLAVTKAATSTGLVVEPTSSVFGDQVTLTATVDAAATTLPPTGTVAFAAGATALGTASLTPCDPPNTDGCAVASLTSTRARSASAPRR